MRNLRYLATTFILAGILLARTFPGAAWAGPAQVTSPDPAALDLVGQLGGITFAVAVQGSYAYVGIGPRLVVFDISSPANPRPVGQSPVLPHLVYKVVVAGDYAYVTDEDDLYILDVRERSHPAIVGQVVTPDYARGVAVRGAHVFIGDGYDVRVFDVSNPAHPVQVGMLTPSPANVPRDIAIVGDYAYAVGWTGGLHVIHIADPAHPVQVGNYDTPGFPSDLAAAGDYVYIADTDLWVVDVSDPAHPLLAGSYAIPGSTAKSVAVAVNTVYVGGWSPTVCSLNVVDVSNPANPIETGYIDVPGVPFGVAVSGSYVFVADDLELLAVNVANPAQPTLAARYQKTPFAQGVTVAGDYVYVADYYRGLRIIQAAGPSVLTEVGSYDSPGNALDVVGRGHHAYLADHNGGLRIIDVSHPASPVEVGVYDPDTAEAWRLALAGNYVYLADYDHDALRIVDVSDPAQPAPVGLYTAPSFSVTALAASETLHNGRRYAYVAGSNPDGVYLRVLDVTDPAHPVSVGLLQNFDGAANDLAIVDAPGGARYVYLVGGRWLNVLDVTDSAHPLLALNVPMPAWHNTSFYGVAIAAHYAYLAYGSRGMLVWDISDPASPTQHLEVDMPAGGGRDVALRDDAVFVADWTGGLVAFAEAELRAAPTAITWMAEVDGADPTPCAVQLTSTGRPITWTATISPSVSWLEAKPLTDATASAVTLTAHITGLSVGRHTTTVTLAGPHNAVTIPVICIVAESIHRLYLPLLLRGS